MSGHSKWSTIKRKKGKADAARGKVFTKLIKEITVAAREGGGDIDANARLRTAVAAAKAANMPADNIKRGIMKGTGELEGVSYEQSSYEGYGPGGVAVLVEVLTDNKNRTVAEIRHIFSKYNGSLGEVGCVGWMFDRRGYIAIGKEKIDEDTLMEKAIEAGASDIQTEGENYEIYTEVADLETVRSALESGGVEADSVELTMNDTAEYHQARRETCRADAQIIRGFGRQRRRIPRLCQLRYRRFCYGEDVRGVMLTVLGIDPGLRITGYAVIRYNGGMPEVREAGVVKTKDKDTFENRLKTIYDGLDAIISEFKPDAISVEKLYSHYNHPQTAVIMGHARGMIFLCAAEHNIPVESYASTRIKKALTGNGRASKLQMQQSVKNLLRLKELPKPPDVADAIATALCHCEVIK